MAKHAVLVQNAGVQAPDADWLVEILKRERFGMVITIFSFCHVFANEIVRHVAIIARGVRMMA